jgi:mutator protein MutT
MDSSSSATVLDIGLALVWRRGCLLVTRRPQNVHLGGLWEFPGGKCLPGEAPEECAEREAREEVGVVCRAERHRHPIEFQYPDRTVRLHPIECTYLGGPPRALQVAEWAWVHPSELHRYPFPPANDGLARRTRGHGYGARLSAFRVACRPRSRVVSSLARRPAVRFVPTSAGYPTG